MAKQEDFFKNVISHAKEYGYIFGSSEIYDGLSAVYDYGQNGVELKKNIREYWWKSMVQLHQNILGLDAAILMHPTTWKASGHVDAFNDPLIDNKDSKKRYRADVLIEDHAEKLLQKAEKEIEKAKKASRRSRGSRVNGCPLTGSTMLAMTLMVGLAKNGSRRAVPASGTASMSDS